MFVIPCKYNPQYPLVINLCEQIRHFHPNEKIVVVDSGSENKSYFDDIKKYDPIILDINNKEWMIGAYWKAYKLFPDEDYYYFMHDSMKVKDNLDSFKTRPLTTLMYFDRRDQFETWGERITKESKYTYVYNGHGLYACSFFCQNRVMKRMLYMGADKFLPTTKLETGYCEGCYGFFLEEQGFNLKETSLFGDVFVVESARGKSGLPPHNTSWQYPIEKFYASTVDINRNF